VTGDPVTAPRRDYPTIAAILFDMDGVLIDSEPVHEAATDEIMRASGVGPISSEVFARYFFGRTDYVGFRDYLAAIGRDDLSTEELMRRKAAAFARRFAEEVRPHPDGLSTLREAAARGYPVAIVSGARNAEIALVVERFQLRPLLAATVGGDDVSEGKPRPAPYLTGASRLEVEPAACVVVEDAPAGIASARAAGMRCLAVDRLGQPEPLRQADRIVTRVSLKAVLSLSVLPG
jgi:HAD superfamily hydrolase (TIGR01509 family)